MQLVIDKSTTIQPRYMYIYTYVIELNMILHNIKLKLIVLILYQCN